MGNKKSHLITIFKNYSNGLSTNRNSWCWNSYKIRVEENIKKMIDFYNLEMKRYKNSYKTQKIKDFVNKDMTKIKWTRGLYKYAEKSETIEFNKKSIVKGMYRPFYKQWVYFDKDLNETPGQLPEFFPKSNLENIIILVNGNSVFITNQLPNLHLIGDAQCFPLKLYEKEENVLSEKKEVKYKIKDGITDDALNHFSYPNENITKEDIFYYIYGILHSKDYQNRFSNNLLKQLPRIPKLKSVKDFWTFSKSGRDLANLHLNYETVEKYPLKFNVNLDTLKDKDFYVDKMKYDKKDLTTLIYNKHITISDIPKEVHDYKIDGVSPLEWIIAWYRFKVDKDSEIVNDANDYANETMENPRYIIDLIQRVITVSLETQKIINNLPNLDL